MCACSFCFVVVCFFVCVGCLFSLLFSWFVFVPRMLCLIFVLCVNYLFVLFCFVCSVWCYVFVVCCVEILCECVVVLLALGFFVANVMCVMCCCCFVCCLFSFLVMFCFACFECFMCFVVCCVCFVFCDVFCLC